MLRCRYCSIYCTGRNRKTEKERDEVTGRTNITHYRHCPFIMGYVTGNRESCEDFIPHQWFFCEREANWMNVLACMGRQDRMYGDCDRCHQGREVLSVIRQMRQQRKELSEPEPEKPKRLVKPVKRLIKRK